MPKRTVLYNSFFQSGFFFSSYFLNPGLAKLTSKNFSNIYRGLEFKLRTSKRVNDFRLLAHPHSFHYKTAIKLYIKF